MTRTSIEIAPGARHFPGYLDRPAQEALVEVLRAAVAAAPLFVPVMPRTGKAFSVRMTNCGKLGWVSDLRGYRYQAEHPDKGTPWPAIPDAALAAWSEIAGFSAPPDACLVNFYDREAKMGLHQDRDEEELDAPVVSLSLGDSCIFRIGGFARGGPTRSLTLQSGDAFVLGGPARLAFHGVDRIIGGSSTLLAQGGRINLTLRRVAKATPPQAT